MWPNQNIKEGFEKITVETKKGAIIEGNKVYESNDAVYVKTATSKDNIKVSKSDIAKQKSHGSLVPQGLTNSLTETEVRDLIRYLSDLGNK